MRILILMISAATMFGLLVTENATPTNVIAAELTLIVYILASIKETLEEIKNHIKKGSKPEWHQ